MAAPHSSPFSPFRHRDFRYQWPADVLTSWAFEMEVLILGWYVLVTTGSVFWLSVLGGLHYIGTLFAPGIGVLGDRIGLRNLLCLMRMAYAALAGTLTILFLTDTASLPVLLVIAGCFGALRPSDLGMRTALVAHTIPKVELHGALAIARTTFDTARIVGSLTGAGMFAAYGIGPAYAAITVCYLLSVLLTLLISPAMPDGSQRARSPMRDLRDGLVYVWSTPHLKASMWLAFLANLTAFPLCIGLLPYVARNVYGIDETGLSYLVASFATGALVGSFLMMRQRSLLPPGQLMIVGSLVWHAFLLAFAFTTERNAGMAMLFGAGIAQSLSMLSVILVLLQTSDGRLRGRVMGVRMLAIYSLPIGLLSAGVLIPMFSFMYVAAGYTIFGIAMTLLIALVWRRDILSPDAIANQ